MGLSSCIWLGLALILIEKPALTSLSLRPTMKKLNTFQKFVLVLHVSIITTIPRNLTLMVAQVSLFCH